MTSLTKTGSLIIIDKKLKNLVPKFIFFEKKKFLKKKIFTLTKLTEHLIMISLSDLRQLMRIAKKKVRQVFMTHLL